MIVSAQVSAETRDQLLELAEKGDRSLSAEVRRAVAEHIKRQEKSA